MLRMLHSPPKFHRAIHMDTDLYDFEICPKREKVNVFYQLYDLYVVIVGNGILKCGYIKLYLLYA